MKHLKNIEYEGWYDVSNLGRIKRVKAACGTTVGMILRPWLSKQGYVRVGLSAGHGRLNHSVHKLVMAAFIGVRPDGMEVNHKDGDKTNNGLDNLEYVTHLANTRHAMATGLWSRRGEDNNNSKLTENTVHKIKVLLGKERRKAIAVLFNVSKSTVDKIAQGQNWWWVK